jgi:probable HAF family extracellular repeat protein
MRRHALSRRTGWTTAACAATLLLTGAPATADVPARTLHTIDLSVPGTDGSVSDINRRGLMVGSFQDADGESRAVLWARPDSPKILGDGLGPPSALNERGDVVGGDWLWRRGTVRHLSDPAGHETAAFVNNRGQVAGSREDEEGRSTAFRWQDGRFTDIGTPAGWYSWATGLNDRGDVIGLLKNADFTVHQGFIWHDGVLTVIDAKGFDTEPAAVNERGEVVGRAGFPGSSSAYHPFRWAHGTVTDLMPGRPDEHGAAHDINDAGDVVGHVANRAALWRDGRTVLIGPGGPEYGGVAEAVNERGDVAGRLGRATSDEDRRVWAFRWRAGTVLLTEPLTGEAGLAVAGIDDQGQLAGTIHDGLGDSRAVIWRP